MEPAQPNLISPIIWKRLAYYRRTARILEHLTTHIAEPMNLVIASEIACMQQNAFSRFFRERIGITFSHFMNAYRIELAMKQMLRSNASLKEIARATGFNCMATFERRFRKATGMSPSRFRNIYLETSRLRDTGRSMNRS